MYAIQLSKDQEKNSQELQANAVREARTQEHPALHAELVSTKSCSASDLLADPASEMGYSKEESIRRIKRGIKNLKTDLTHNFATLPARRNIGSALEEMHEELRILESQP